MKTCVIGASGRMGKQIILNLAAIPNCNLLFAICDSGSVLINKKVTEHYHISNSWEVCFSAEIGKISNNIDVIIDFSQPKATIALLNHLIEIKFSGVIIVGTTGIESTELDRLSKVLSVTAKIILVSNTSLSAMVTKKICSDIAKMLPDADVEIVETHHKNKADSPSGTALDLGKAIAKARNISFEDAFVMRNIESKKRETGDIGFASVRGGNVVGIHSVMFFYGEEAIEIKHTVQNRSIFADGAIKLAIAGLKKLNEPCLITDDEILTLLT